MGGLPAPRGRGGLRRERRAASVAPERLASYRKLLGELEELEAERAGS